MKILSFVLVLTAALSCAKKESIDPLFEPRKTSETKSNQQIIDKLMVNFGRFQLSNDIETDLDPATLSIQRQQQAVLNQVKLTYVRGKYFIPEVPINRPVSGGLGPITTIGNTIADIITIIAGGIHIDDMDPIPLDLTAVDFNVIQDVRIQEVKFNVFSRELDPKANLKFVDEVKIFVKSSGSKEEEKKLMIYYDKDNPEHRKKAEECQWKCIVLDARNINLVELAKKEKKIFVMIEAKIGEVPSAEFFIKGHLKFAVGLNIGF